MLEPCQEANQFVPVVSFSDPGSSAAKDVRGTQTGLSLVSRARDTVMFQFTDFQIDHDGALLDCTLKSPDMDASLDLDSNDIILLFRAQLTQQLDTGECIVVTSKTIPFGHANAACTSCLFCYYLRTCLTACCISWPRAFRRCRR
jgi:hypothetical protein